MARCAPMAAAVALGCIGLGLSGATGASAKTDEKAPPHLRYARSYAEAMAEARERGCVVFATFHSDG